MFLIYDVSWRSHVVLLTGLKYLIVIPHLAKFGGHRPCGSSDTAARIFYVTSEDHVISYFDNGYVIILVSHVTL